MKTIKEYFKYKDWYKLSQNYFKANFGNDYKLVIKLICATSPRKSVKANFNLALNIYYQFKNNGIVYFKGIGLMPNAKSNVIRALKGQELSGNKVNAFYHNLIGNTKKVTIDIWMKRYLKLDDKFILTNKRYKDYSKIISLRAKQYNLKPAEFQAVVWAYTREKYGYKNSINYAECI